MDDVLPELESLETLFNSDASIHVWSGIDDSGHLREKLDDEFMLVPLTNPQAPQDDDDQSTSAARIILVYIENFFKDGCHFAYYVRGGAKMSNFLARTFSKKPYDEPCFATPCCIHDIDSLTDEGVRQINYDRVSKTETKGIRWRFLYNSAVKAWNQLEFDKLKLEIIRKIAAEDELARQAERLKAQSTSPTSPASPPREDDELEEGVVQEESAGRRESGMQTDFVSSSGKGTEDMADYESDEDEGSDVEMWSMLDGDRENSED